jgi:hypothetical protein
LLRRGPSAIALLVISIVVHRRSRRFEQQYGEGVPDRNTLRRWVASKLAYDKARADEGQRRNPAAHGGLKEAREAFAEAVDPTSQVNGANEQ